MAFKLFPSLAATAFAALLFNFFLKRRSGETNGKEANKDAAANDGTARGDSGTHTSTVHEMATSSGTDKDAAANDETARGDSGTHTSTEVPEMATSSGANKDAAANDGTARGASSSHASIEGHGMATSSGYDYEVFLSFRGPDTRACFTDFLYTSLKDVGIRTFKDDEDLRKGEEFGPELLQAINQSKISMPILSKDYASSVWCLKELVHMVECQKTGGQKIMPIFYDVAPFEVRHQTGDYGEAFRLHEKKQRYDDETLSQWKAALNAVGAITGWDLHSKIDRREGEFAKTVTHEVFNELKKPYLEVSDCLVSVDHHVDEIMKKIGARTSETRVIVIHGMGGVGKSTIAKIIYNELSHNFNNCCFLSNIREMSESKGIKWLQHQLISDILKMEWTNTMDRDEGTRTIKSRLSNKRVLLLLDDVDEKKHMDALVGKRNWFGEGSKLIITTRNKGILQVPIVDDHHEVSVMDSIQSLQLFCKHALRRDSPLDGYINQSNRAIGIAGGLPLALEVIGSLLSLTKKEMWDETLDKLANVPPLDVQSKLEVSFDKLDARQQHIFLDIACLFIGYDKDIVVHFWEKSKFFPEEAMEILQNMSLIKITENKEVWMHDQLRDLGREMVRQKSEMEIEKQSRVWNPQEALDLLTRLEGNKVEALRLKFDHEGQYCFTYEDFRRLPYLRFLAVDGSKKNFRAEERLIWHKSPLSALPTKENSYLLPRLRWLSWHDIPTTFNITKFSMKDVVILDLSMSAITYNWKGWSHMEVMKNLKVLNLSRCGYLERLLDSIWNLESLIELNINYSGIKELPESIRKLKNLKVLKIWLSKISKIPGALWTMENLEKIEYDRENLSTGHVKVGKCISRIPSLRILTLTHAEICPLPPKLPESLIHLQLGTLNMDTFPDLSKLSNLKKLDLTFRSPDFDEITNGPGECPIPQWIGNLSKLKSLVLRSEYVTTSPAGLSLPPQLKSLRLECSNLRRLPRLPSSLSSIQLYDCKSLDSVIDLSNLKNLSSLQITRAAIPKLQGLGCLKNLRDLQLNWLGEVNMLPDLRNLSKLWLLQVRSCDNLVEIQGKLPRSLDDLHISNCRSLQRLPSLSSLMGKTRVEIYYCDRVLEHACMDRQDLELVGFTQLSALPDLSNSNKLRRLRIENCGNLAEIQGTLPQSLRELKISSCKSLRKLPDLSSLKELRKVDIEGCTKLNVEAILGSAWRSQTILWENLGYLRICGLGQVGILLDPSNFNKLRRLQVEDCGNLVEIQGKLPQSLEELEFDSCKSLRKLPDLSSLNGLQKVKIQRCYNLDVEAISKLCSEKSVIFVEED